MKTLLKFRFYFENQIKESFELDEIALKEKFKEWLQTKEKLWLKYHYSQLVNVFISNSEGLNSTMDKDHYEKVEEVLKDTKWNYLNSIGIK